MYKYTDYIDGDGQEWTSVERMKQLHKAYLVLRLATFQSHMGHWDNKGTRGLNCPACIEIKKIREEADGIVEDLDLE